MRRNPDRGAFTLIELLIVMAILGLLLGMIVPAVFKVRESANRTVCQNNLKNLALAFHSHQDATRRFPSGGWGWDWVGVPGRGTGQDQPGGWGYNILPFMGQDAIHAAGAATDVASQTSYIRHVLQTVLVVYNCPTRRDGTSLLNGRNRDYLYSDQTNSRIMPTILARTDYAANCGGDAFDEINGGPPAYNVPANYDWFPSGRCPDATDKVTGGFKGIVFRRSLVKLSDVTAGTSSTYMLGEKYLNPDSYTSGNDVADNETLYTGFNNDVTRCTSQPPKQDRAGEVNTLRFGSAHIGGLYMAYCDGSVRFVEYGVAAAVHKKAGNRMR